MTYKMKTAPYAHQQTAFDYSRDEESYALLMEMGTGKTKVLIDTISYLFEQEKINGALILAPKGVIQNWPKREIPEHMPNRTVEMMLMEMWQSGPSKALEKRLMHLVNAPPNCLTILCMNVEALSNPKSAAMALAKTFVERRSSVAIVDESTCIKNPRAKRSKSVLKLGDLSDYRRIATGSPVTQSPLDLFSQFAFLDKRILGHSSFTAFRSHYAIMQQHDFGGRLVMLPVGYQNLDELKVRIAPHSFRILKEDCLDLPPKVYEVREVELTPEQKRIYKSIKTSAEAELDTGEWVSATEVITQILRLHQLLCGHAVDEHGVHHTVPSNRMSVLEGVLEETSGKVIIWATYIRSIEEILERLRKIHGDDAVVAYYGATSDADREVAIERFQNDPECRFFVGNPQTAGYGITLTAAGTVVYYANSWDLEKRQQSEDRCHRIGQSRSVTYVDLVCQGTVDAKIIQALRRKINLATAITGDTYREWLI